jgi:hypothetical protein
MAKYNNCAEINEQKLTKNKGNPEIFCAALSKTELASPFSRFLALLPNPPLYSLK